MSTDKLQEMDKVLAEIFREPPLISTQIEPAPATSFDPPNEEEPSVQAPAVDAAPDAEDALRRAEQAKSLLSGLNLDTAIRLRWAMRDIRSKRTKLTPVSENDLAALVDLGFVEMQEGIPRLTGLGVLALD
ncbi:MULTISPECIES: hypothetical protein [unclassified Bradyrhizobium]|uniref:hypothetical protein n=1 Tax=unclassified Bradyrhizobium TaxID=2631580 RepID=UPI001BA94B60|nr:MULTISPECIES: hypothetical protein [unclassified Bradyrhizobium]MBR1225513.1 hypothetical protein [Bradyrhizobium sp. AUGA SZCCT0176]MBR1232131.1 hypothetical protein [Bradyrhizobium sp. AUGA SZCCT0182]MBR1298024.1 hypothetical protein [Bradyrhizobium sp. AUGA SZCCT0042]